MPRLMLLLIVFFLLSLLSPIQGNICSICLCGDVKIDCLRRLVDKNVTAELFKDPPEPTFEVSLRWNDITSLPADVFKYLPELEMLDLGFNKLSTLQEGIFDNAPNLADLNMEENQLNSLPTKLFSKNSQLKSLMLSMNKLTSNSFPSSLFSNLKQLKSLDIAGNPISILPSTFASLTGLEELSAYAMGLTSVENIFQNMPNLKKLEFAENKIETFPDASTLPSSLKYLGLAMNRLRSPPTNLKSLGSLKTLTLAENSGFTCLKQKLAYFGWGITKDVDGCKSLMEGEIVKVGGALGGVDQIKKISSEAMSLIIRGNELTELPAGIFDRFTGIVDLDLSFNNLKALPADIFDKLANLEMLSLAYNQLEGLPAGIFSKLTKLKTLSIAGNKLTASSIKDFPNLLKGLKKMDMLQIEFNNFQTIPKGFFDDLTNLKTLTMFNTEIKEIPIGLFDKTHNLESIDLTENNIENFDKNTFKNLQKLKKLTFLNNKLTADSVRGAFDGLPSLANLLLASNPGILCIELENYKSGISAMPDLCNKNSMTYKAQISAGSNYLLIKFKI